MCALRRGKEIARWWVISALVVIALPGVSPADEDWKKAARDAGFWEELYATYGRDAGGVTLLHEAETETQVLGGKYFLVTKVRLVQAVFDPGASGIALSWELPMSGDRQLKDVRGRTYLRDGQEQELKGRDVSDVTPYADFPLYAKVESKRFALPAVTAESIIEVQFKWVEGGGGGEGSWQGLGSFDSPAAEGIAAAGGPYLLYRFPFDSELPVRLSRYAVAFSPELAGQGLGQQYVTYGSVPAPRSESFFSPDGERMRVSWEVTDRPAVVREPMMPPWWDVIAYVSLSPTRLRWSELAMQYYKEHVVHPLVEDQSVLEKVREIIGDAGTDEEKAKMLYDWVQQSIEFVSLPLQEAGYVPEHPRAVMEAGHGNGRDQAVLLTALLRGAGLEAHPVVVRTAELGHLDEALVALPQFDHMVCLVELGGKEIWCDPTESFIPFGSLPLKDQGVKGLVLKEAGGGLVDLPTPRSGSSRLVRTFHGELSAEGELRGTLEITADGNAATIERRELWGGGEPRPEDWLRSILVAGESATTAQGIALEGEMNTDTPFKAEARVDVPNGPVVAGDSLLLTPFITHLRGYSAPVPISERRHPVRNTIAFSETDTVTITLPGGWMLVENPQTRRLSCRMGTFTLKISQKERILHVVRSVKWLRGEWAAAEYGKITTFLESVGQAGADRLMLIKEAP